MEVKSDLDNDVSNASNKIADKMRESLKGYSNDLFKELRQGLQSSLDKVTETIENCLNKTKSDMQAYVEAMKSIVSGAKLEMPIINNENAIKPMESVSQKANAIRGPPTSKISMPSIDLSGNSEVIKAQINDTISQMSILNATIKNQESELDTLTSKYEAVKESITKREEAKASLDEQKKSIEELKNSIQDFKNKPLEFRLNNLELLDELNSKLESAKEKYKEMQDTLASKKTVGLESQLDAIEKKILRLQSDISSNNVKKVALEQSVGGLQEKIEPVQTEQSIPSANVGKLDAIKAKLLSIRQEVKRCTTDFISSVPLLNKGLNLAYSGVNKLKSGLTGLGKDVVGATGKFALFTLGLNKAKNSSNGAGNSFGGLVKRFALFSVIFPAVSKAVTSLATTLWNTLKTNKQFVSSLNQIQSNLNTAFTPIYQAIMPMLNALMSALAKLTGYIASFISTLFGKSIGQTKKATASIISARDALTSTGKSAKDTAKKVKEATKSLMGFDEINNLNKNKNNDSSGSGGGGSVYTPSNLDNSSVNDFAKKLREMWKNGDYSGIGKAIGEKINDAVSSFTDYISWDHIGGKITQFVNGFCDLFNSLIATINWENVGKMFGTGINTIANTLYLLLNGIDWQRIGQALAEGLNGLVHTVDWTKLGATIGSYLQARIDALYGFVTTADWAGIGKGLADGVMGLINRVDWDKFAQSLALGISGAISTIHNFITNIDWSSLGQKIGSSINSFFSNINWADFGMTLSDAALGILNTLSNALATVDWYKLGDDIADFITSIDWAGIIVGLGAVLVQAIVGLDVTLFHAFCKIVGSMWDGFCQGVSDFFSDPGGFIKDNIVDPFIKWFKSLFGIHSPSTVMKELGQYVMQGLINGLKSMPIVGSIAGLIGDGIDWIKGKYGEFKEKGKTLIDKVKNGISNNSVVKNIGSVVSNGISAIKDKYEEFKSKGSDLMGKFKNGIDSAKSAVSSTVSSVMSTVSSSITSVTSSAYSWGSDMMSGFSKGINSAKDWVIGGVKSVASSVKSLLHFSRPDEGPLRDYETWMPDFMEGMAKGIENNKFKLLNSVKGLSNELAMSFNSLQQPEIAFAGSQELNVNHFVKSDDSNLSEIIKSYIDELGNRNNDNAQVIVKVLYELIDAVNDKELNVDADALNKSNKKKDLERLLRRGK